MAVTPYTWISASRETFPGHLSRLNWTILKKTCYEMDTQCITLLNKFSFAILQLYCHVGSFCPNSYKTLLHNTINIGLSKYSCLGCLSIIEAVLRLKTAWNWRTDLFTVTAELSRKWSLQIANHMKLHWYDTVTFPQCNFSELTALKRQQGSFLKSCISL
jgi:hypothetical protein